MDIRDRKEQLATDILKLTRAAPADEAAGNEWCTLLPEWKYRNDGKSTGTDGICLILESGGGAPLVSRCTDTGGEEISASGSSLPVSSSAAGTSR